MKNKLLILFLFVLVSSNVSAQREYTTALGLRLNGGVGITGKHFISDNKSLEGIIYTRWHGLNFCGLYQMNYKVIPQEPGFNFYMGAGAHIGVWDQEDSPWWDDEDTGNQVVIGIDGQIGLEYTFKGIPLNLGLDWKPAINLIGSTNFWADDLGLSVRYVIR